MTTRFRNAAFIVQDAQGNALAGIRITLWTAESGGTQVTAVTSPSGAALPGYVESNAKGEWDFNDPANHNQFWAQRPAAPGQPLPGRVLIESVEASEATGTIGAQFPAVQAAASAAATKADAATLTAATANSRSQEAIDAVAAADVGAADVDLVSVFQGALA